LSFAQTLHRPYGLLVASASKDSVSRGSKFMVTSIWLVKTPQYQHYIDFSFASVIGQDWQIGPIVPTRQESQL